MRLSRESHSVSIEYSVWHLECDLISISNPNLSGLFLAERGKRELDYRLRFENEVTLQI